MRLFDWAKEKITIIRKAAYDTAVQVKNAANSIYYSYDIWEKFNNVLFQVWDGFSRVFYLPLLVEKLKKSEKLRETFKQSASANLVLYMGSVLLYEAGVKRLLRMVPYMEESTIEYAIDMLARMYFIRKAISMFVDNTAYNLNVSKAISEEIQHNRHIQPCDCDSTAVIQAGLASSFYYIGKTKTVQFVSSLLPYGEYVTFPLRLFVNGECLLEYKLGAAGMCTVHRNEALNKNQAYSFGMGLSYSSLLWLCNYIVRSTTGVDSYFVYDALSYFLYQYHITMAYLIDKPLPGQHEGMDLFYHSRMVTESLLTSGSNKLISFLRNPDDRGNWIENAQTVIVFPPVNLLMIVLVEEDFKSPKKFIKRPAIDLLLNVYGNSIQTNLDWIIKKRDKMKEMPFLSFVYPYLPNFILSDTTKKTLDILLNKNLDGVLESMNHFFDEVGLQHIKFHGLYAKKFTDKKMQDLINNDYEYQPSAAPGRQENANLDSLKQVVHDLVSIIQSPYWDDKGAALFQQTKIPDGIKKMRAFLNFIDINNMKRKQLNDILKNLAGKCNERLNVPDKNRNSPTRKFYDLIIDIGSNPDRDFKKAIDEFKTISAANCRKVSPRLRLQSPST